MKTDIFKSRFETTDMDSDYARGMTKTAQSPSESRDANLPGMRMNPAMGVQNIHKSAPATGRRP